jgi:prevent-host-death family protein
MKSIAAKEARDNFSALLDNAERGKSAIVVRNSRPAAAIMPAESARLAPIIDAVMKEFGLSVEMSEDAEILEAYARAKDEMERGEIVWYEA